MKAMNANVGKTDTESKVNTQGVLQTIANGLKSIYNEIVILNNARRTQAAIAQHTRYMNGISESRVKPRTSYSSSRCSCNLR